MPKKQGVNTKAVEAKLRKESAKKAKEELLQKQKDDEYWKDDDKHVNKKLERQQQREAKKQETLLRKAQNRAAYEEESQNTSTSSVKDKKQPTNKVTRSQIQNILDKQKDSATSGNSSSGDPRKEPLHLEVPLEENVNRMKIEGDEARNIDEAIVILSSGESDLDRHPERRVKAAWLAYVETHLSRLKQENPSLRLSQIKEMLRKEFNKSPDNPLNQASLANRGGNQ